MASDRYALFGGKLGAEFPTTTTAMTLYTALATTEITRIQVCNVTNNNCDYYVYHDDAGTSYGTATALVFSKQVSGKNVDVIEAASQGSGITVKKGGTIGVQSSAASHLNFTVYGIVQMVR